MSRTSSSAVYSSPSPSTSSSSSGLSSYASLSRGSSTSKFSYASSLSSSSFSLPNSAAALFVRFRPYFLLAMTGVIFWLGGLALGVWTCFHLLTPDDPEARRFFGVFRFNGAIWLLHLLCLLFCSVCVGYWRRFHAQALVASQQLHQPLRL